MRKYSLILTVVGLVVLMSLGGGCKNPDNNANPNVPNPQGPNPTGDPMDPNIPAPFAYPIPAILDIGIEGDGDVVLGTEEGMLLFTPYGVFKRVLSGVPVVGIATSNFGQVDTGRGVMAISPGVDECRPFPSYDDLYVSGGVPHVTPNAAWWAGDPDPYYPDICVDIASTSSFVSCQNLPHPIAYHPQTAFYYTKVYAGDCIADGDCPWPYGNSIPDPAGGYAILAYHPDAPLPPDYMSMIFEGGQDFLVYYDYPTFQRMQTLAAMVYGIVPACALHNLFLIWDLTSINYMSSRDGMTAENIGDFEFDMLNRLIIAMPNADSVAITDPVVFGEPIVIQQVIGGRQNGMGTLPGEFQGPRAVAIDPRNQNIYISDTGNGRVQVFDNDGNFIREFGGGDPTFAPGAIRVDAFGAVYVANVSPQRPEGDNLRIFDEYGAKITYGTIEGWVFDQATHQPVDNVRVRSMSTFLPLDTVTDNKGHFIFPAVAAGTHNIVADKYGYESGQATVTVIGGQKTVVDIYIKRVMTQPPGFGMVTGTVMSSLYNEPVPGLTAEILGTGISNITNGNGEFTLYNVPEGEHTLRLSSGGTIWYEKYITVTKGEILDIGILYLPIP